MRLVIISDTHGLHEQLGQLEGDVLIHCGDGCPGRSRAEINSLDAWFGRQQFEKILVVGGNHDVAVEDCVHKGIPAFRHAQLLQDEAVQIDGVRFYGSPWVPGLPGMAFHARDEDLRAAWEAIPHDTDVLITHTPPAGVLDRSSRGEHLGCAALREVLLARPVALHCFGHIHASRGLARAGLCTFVNASSMARGRARLRAPMGFTLERRAGLLWAAPTGPREEPDNAAPA